MQDVYTAFGITPPAPSADPPATPPAGDPPAGTPAPATEPPATDPPTTDPPATDPPATDPPATPPGPDKAQQAFAAMRVQNKQYETLLKSMAEVLGVQETDPVKMTDALKEKIIDAQAKAQNIDPKLLGRLQQLEEKNQYHEREETQRLAYLGFQRVKENFGLDDASLQQFATQLATDGINPFAERLDLVNAYISRNYPKLMADAEARGVQKEAERAANATGHSTVPGTSTGGTPEPASKIDSIAALNTWANQQGGVQK